MTHKEMLKTVLDAMDVRYEERPLGDASYIHITDEIEPQLGHFLQVRMDFYFDAEGNGEEMSVG